MHGRVAKVLALLVACLMAIALTNCSQSPLRVRSAERSRGYSLGTRTVYPEKPGDVFLKVSYSELLEDDRKKDLYITDGKTRYPVQLFGFTIEGSKKHSFVVVTVPGNQLEFQAVLGDYPPVSFKAEEAIHDQL